MESILSLYGNLPGSCQNSESVLSVQESLLISALFMQTFYLLPVKNPAKKKGFAFKLEQEPVVNVWRTMPKTRGHAQGSTWCLIPYWGSLWYSSVWDQRKICEFGSANITFLFLFDHDLKTEGEKKVWKETYRAIQSVRVMVRPLRLQFLQSRTMLRRELEHGLFWRVITYSINWILVCKEFMSSNNIL